MNGVHGTIKFTMLDISVANLAITAPVGKRSRLHGLSRAALQGIISAEVLRARWTGPVLRVNQAVEVVSTFLGVAEHLLEPAVLVLCVALETIGQCYAQEPLLEPAPAVAHVVETNTAQDAVDHLLEPALIVAHAVETNTAQDAAEHQLEPASVVLRVVQGAIGQCSAQEPLQAHAVHVPRAVLENSGQCNVLEPPQGHAKIAQLANTRWRQTH